MPNEVSSKLSIPLPNALSNSSRLLDIQRVKASISAIDNIIDSIGGGIVGPAGPSGPQGLEGPQGPQGIQGLQGPAGGSEGAIEGPQGIQGPAGPQGPMGPAGPQGLEGPKGTIGFTGPQGPAGSGGAVNTTPTVMTDTFFSVNNGIYILGNTTVGNTSLFMRLPSNPTAGNKVSFNLKSSNTNWYIDPVSSNINGISESLTLDVPGAFGTLLYVDSIVGWVFN